MSNILTTMVTKVTVMFGKTFEVSGVLLETYLSHVTLTPVEILHL